MQDTIIKGTGNSRTLTSVQNFLTLYPTYEDFAQALISRTLPIDLGPLNPAGVKTMGDSLDKETLLKDTTAALYGLPATAVPDDVLVKTLELINANKGTSAFGSYVGHDEDTIVLHFPFAVKFLIVIGSTGPYYGGGSLMLASKELTTHNFIIHFYDSTNGTSVGRLYVNTMTFNDSIVSWTDTTHLLSALGYGYTYAAFG